MPELFIMDDRRDKTSGSCSKSCPLSGVVLVLVQRQGNGGAHVGVVVGTTCQCTSHAPDRIVIQRRQYYLATPG